MPCAWCDFSFSIQKCIDTFLFVYWIIVQNTCRKETQIHTYKLCEFNAIVYKWAKKTINLYVYIGLNLNSKLWWVHCFVQISRKHIKTANFKFRLISSESRNDGKIISYTSDVGKINMCHRHIFETEIKFCTTEICSCQDIISYYVMLMISKQIHVFSDFGPIILLFSTAGLTLSHATCTEIIIH